jgi:D-beta-D-heptose 7-phosphate kinase/D-beta-D-heptose 1-phosphate adenosyltransferase
MKNHRDLRLLLSLIDKFPKKKIFVLGDLMLDHFIHGQVRRISPEAPVPVVTVTQETHAPGGSGNVCGNLAALEAQVSIFSVVGEDSTGREILQDLAYRGVDTSAVQVDSGRVSTQKTRIVAEHQQVVRFDRETVQPMSAKIQTQLLENLESRIGEAQALVLSDYGKGVITPRVLAEAIRSARKAGIPVIVDPKIEHFRRYKGIDCITPNLQEAWLGMRLLPSSDEKALEKLGRSILDTLRVKILLITRGEKGMTLFENNKSHSIYHIPTQAQEVYDVTGAGDTVTSVMALALASGGQPRSAAVLANVAAGIVVGKLGTATVSISELKKGIRNLST